MGYRLALIVLLLGGCAEELQSHPANERDAGVDRASVSCPLGQVCGSSCCGSGNVCIDGVCRSGDGCAFPCSPGFHCELATCIPDPPCGPACADAEADATEDAPVFPPPCEDLPDFTTYRATCHPVDGGVRLSAFICNRGTRSAGGVGVALSMGDGDGGAPGCVARADQEIATGSCVPVSCVANEAGAGSIRSEVNPPDLDGHRVEECNYLNNEDLVRNPECTAEPPIE
jgi:hypothetical protein